MVLRVKLVGGPLNGMTAQMPLEAFCHGSLSLEAKHLDGRVESDMLYRATGLTDDQRRIVLWFDDGSEAPQE